MKTWSIHKQALDGLNKNGKDQLICMELKELQNKNKKTKNFVKESNKNKKTKDFFKISNNLEKILKTKTQFKLINQHKSLDHLEWKKSYEFKWNQNLQTVYLRKHNKSDEFFHS
jgi:hypothetical protein